MNNEAQLSTGEVQAAYRSYAHWYNFLFRRVFQAGREAALKELNPQPGQKVLEVGVGTGLSLAMYPKGVQLTGIDLTPEMLALGRERAAKLGIDCQLLEMDAQTMSFPDASFDMAVGMYVATVAPNPEKMLSEMRRVVKPGGRVLFVNHFSYHHSRTEWGESWLTRFAKVLGWKPLFYLDDYLERVKLKPLVVRKVGLLRYFTLLEFER